MSERTTTIQELIDLLLLKTTAEQQDHLGRPAISFRSSQDLDRVFELCLQLRESAPNQTSLSSVFAKVREFVEKAGQPHPSLPLGETTAIEIAEKESCFSILLEEISEFAEALGIRLYPPDNHDGFVTGYGVSGESIQSQLSVVVHELIDVIYVAMTIAVRLGIDPVPLLNIVADANLRKFGPGHSRDPVTLKLIKPPGFVGPKQQIREELDRQRGVSPLEAGLKEGKDEDHGNKET